MAFSVSFRRVYCVFLEPKKLLPTVTVLFLTDVLNSIVDHSCCKGKRKTITQGRCENQSHSCGAMYQGDEPVPIAKYLTSKQQDQFKQLSTVSVGIRNMMFITQALCMSHTRT
jgi:hypothetical protein